jgi:uncharacterized protein YhbP (UPF0306 family)
VNLDLEAIIRDYIDKSLHLSLATVSENKPWVCELHFVFDDDLNLYWRSKADTRHSQDTLLAILSGNTKLMRCRMVYILKDKQSC